MIKIWCFFGGNCFITFVGVKSIRLYQKVSKKSTIGATFWSSLFRSLIIICTYAFLAPWLDFSNFLRYCWCKYQKCLVFIDIPLRLTNIDKKILVFRASKNIGFSLKNRRFHFRRLVGWFWGKLYTSNWIKIIKGHYYFNI